MKKHLLIFRFLLLAVLFSAFSCTKDPAEAQPDTPTPPPSEAGSEINRSIDNYLKERYLWNDEYKTLKPDFTLEYDDFLSETLMGMTSNTLDKKRYLGDKGYYYSLYSYIVRTPLSVRSASGAKQVFLPEAENGFGIASITGFGFTNSPGYGFMVTAVYPGTPAAKAGIDRGFQIIEVDGKDITEKNYTNLYNLLTDPQPSGTTVVLTENKAWLPTKTLTTEEYFPNPLLYASIIEAGSRKVGYLAYRRFDMAYDDNVLDLIEQFKASGINELVLDLRLNGGGHVPSAVMISSCIAGAAGQGKVFQYYRYNDTRMADYTKTTNETGNLYDPGRKWFYENFLSDESYYYPDLRPYALNLSRVYVLVSESTASASEAVINSLKGIGIPVTIIGVKTNGKNVGMEPVILTDEAYSYELTPITFQGYNAAGQTVDPQGIVPNYLIDDWDYDMLPFGNPDEPMLKKALSLISGVQEGRSAGMRRARTIVPLDIDLPSHGVEGMIQLPHGTEPGQR